MSVWLCECVQLVYLLMESMDTNIAMTTSTEVTDIAIAMARATGTRTN
jgi:hypothetical protein